MSPRQYFEELGRRLRAARERKGWTQLRLSVELGVTKVTVHYWEHGIKRINDARYAELDRVFGGRW